jgi:two-component system, OmpR family, sensor histidine kinase CiaH
MFTSARITLTAWYLVIIMAVSIFFSIALYQVSTQEIQRVMQRITMDMQQPLFPFAPQQDIFTHLESLEEIKQRIQVTLIVINTGIFFFAGGAGYFLAGRTLRPIQQMVSEQQRFITDASHELRTPITALRAEMEAQLLQKIITEKETRAVIASNLEEVIQLQQLTDALLQFSQDDSEAQCPLVSINLSVVARSAIKKIAPLAHKKKIKILSEIQNISLMAHESSLKELLLILLDNAVKYSPSNTVITLKGFLKGKSVTILVSDQGIGMTAIVQQHMFDRFYRGDSSRRKNGYGLGLSIAKQIVEKYKGKIFVSSKLNTGTTFTIMLPQRLSES